MISLFGAEALAGWVQMRLVLGSRHLWLWVQGLVCVDVKGRVMLGSRYVLMFGVAVGPAVVL